MVGSAILHRLRQEGYTNIVTRSHQELDLTNQSAVRDFFTHEKIEYVILAAARVGGIHANNTYPAEFICQNLMIQTHVIHEAYLAGIRGLLFLGSSCIYPRNCPQPMEESHLLTGLLEKTNDAYAVAKIAGLKMCEAYNRQYGTQYRALMPCNLFGPNDSYDLENCHVLPALIRKFHLAKLVQNGEFQAIAEDEKKHGLLPPDIKVSLDIETSGGNAPPKPQVPLWGSGSPLREFLHVDDLAAAAVFIMNLDNGTYHRVLFEGAKQQQKGVAEPQPVVFVNIGSGKEITIRELAQTIAKVVGYQGDILWDSSKPDGTPRKLLDISISAALGWQPTISLKAGIENTYQHYLGFQ